jgi:hypothetical protein
MIKQSLALIVFTTIDVFLDILLMFSYMFLMFFICSWWFLYVLGGLYMFLMVFYMFLMFLMFLYVLRGFFDVFDVFLYMLLIFMFLNMNVCGIYYTCVWLQYIYK